MTARNDDGKTQATVEYVASRMAAGEQLTGIDGFWIAVARRELTRLARNRERVIQAAAEGLGGKRMHTAKARRLAIAALAAGGHPALTEPLLRGVPIEMTSASWEAGRDLDSRELAIRNGVRAVEALLPRRWLGLRRYRAARALAIAVLLAAGHPGLTSQVTDPGPGADLA